METHLNTCPFHIGQEVVALVTLPHEISGGIVKGTNYPVLSLSQCCKCHTWHVGFKECKHKGNMTGFCFNCMTDHVLPFDGHFIAEAKFFAPVARLSVSDKLTIAEGLAKDSVPEKIDVPQKVEVCQ